VTNSSEPAGLEILAKADAVITALEIHGELAVARIAEIVGEPVSSTYRLLQNLTTLEWVESGSKRGLYRLGLAFLRVGVKLESQLDIRQAALGPLKQLREASGCTAFMCVLRGDRAVCIERVEGVNVRSLAMQLGDSLPLYVGAAPTAILAYLPTGERRDYLQRFQNGGEGPYTVPSIKSLSAKLEETRSQGYSVSDGDVTPGITAIGAPVFNHRGELVAAVSASGLREHILDDDKKVTAMVLRAAELTSQALAYKLSGDSYFSE